MAEKEKAKDTEARTENKVSAAESENSAELRLSAEDYEAMSREKEREELKEELRKEILEEEKKKRRRRAVIIFIMHIILLIIFLLMCRCGCFCCNRDGTRGGTNMDPNAVAGELEGKSPDEIRRELNQIVEDGAMIISVNTEVRMKDGSSPAPVRIENSRSNIYFQKVRITLDKPYETIYESGLIPTNHQDRKSVV